LEGDVDIETWQIELDRVNNDLDQIKKECDFGKQRGVGAGADDIEEARFRIMSLSQLLKEIQATCHPEVCRVFHKVASVLSENLSTIRKQEIQINQNNHDDVRNLRLFLDFEA
jgi:hypothetical protein